jgi:hypothetical protein
MSTSLAAASSLISSQSPTAACAPPAPPPLWGGPHDLVARLHHWRPLVRADAVVHFVTASLTVTGPPRWAPFHPTGLKQFRWLWACPSTKPCLAPRRRLAGIDRRSHSGEAGEKSRALFHGPSCFRWLGEMHYGPSPVAQCQLLFSIQFNSIQIQIKFKLLKFIGTWRYSNKF